MQRFKKIISRLSRNQWKFGEIIKLTKKIKKWVVLQIYWTYLKNKWFKQIRDCSINSKIIINKTRHLNLPTKYLHLWVNNYSRNYKLKATITVSWNISSTWLLNVMSLNKTYIQDWHVFIFATFKKLLLRIQIRFKLILKNWKKIQIL